MSFFLMSCPRWNFGICYSALLTLNLLANPYTHSSQGFYLLILQLLYFSFLCFSLMLGVHKGKKNTNLVTHTFAFSLIFITGFVVFIIPIWFSFQSFSMGDLAYSWDASKIFYPNSIVFPGILLLVFFKSAVLK